MINIEHNGRPIPGPNFFPAAATTAKSAAANRPPGRRGGRTVARPFFLVAAGGVEEGGGRPSPLPTADRSVLGGPGGWAPGSNFNYLFLIQGGG